MQKKELPSVIPHLRLWDFIKISQWPALRGMLVSLIPPIMVVIFCSYALSQDIIGVSTFREQYDTVEVDSERGLK